jgi:uncharacterized protein YodC (DUF2158 family)
MAFKAGDVVHLKSGGPEMTIKGIIGDPDNSLSQMEQKALSIRGHKDGEIYCQFYSNSKLESAVFKPFMLELSQK